MVIGSGGIRQGTSSRTRTMVHRSSAQDSAVSQPLVLPTDSTAISAQSCDGFTNAERDDRVVHYHECVRRVAATYRVSLLHEVITVGHEFIGQLGDVHETVHLRRDPGQGARLRIKIRRDDERDFQTSSILLTTLSTFTSSSFIRSFYPRLQRYRITKGDTVHNPKGLVDSQVQSTSNTVQG